MRKLDRISLFSFVDTRALQAITETYIDTSGVNRGIIDAPDFQ
jgi:hypothetical protein